MIIFDEKKYSEKVLNNKKYNTKKNQGRERGAIVRYLNSLGLSIDEIKKTLHTLPIFEGEYLTYDELDKIFDRIVNKAFDYEYIFSPQIGITKSELEVLLSQDSIEKRNLLFVYIVYYKWAMNILHLSFYSQRNNFKMVVENDKELWKIANLSKLKVYERFKICQELVEDGLYKQDNFKSYNYYYLPFIDLVNEPLFFIVNFDNIIGELDYYLDRDKFVRCEVCGIVVKKTIHNRKYCSNCAKEINIKKTLKNKKV